MVKVRNFPVILVISQRKKFYENDSVVVHESRTLLVLVVWNLINQRIGKSIKIYIVLYLANPRRDTREQLHCPFEFSEC